MLDVFLSRKTPYFTISGISSTLEYHPEWEVPEPSEEEKQQLSSLFQQKFTYLDCGAQSFVFLSEDGKSVLKLFRYDRNRLPYALTILPLPSSLSRWREKLGEKKEARLKSDFASYLLAYRELREESGILFLHLNKTHFLNQKLTIIDKIGISHTLSLDEMEFLIQKRLKVASEVIGAHMAKGELESAQKKLESLLELTLLRYRKGIYDGDAWWISQNYGFEGEKPMFLDIGRLQKNPDYSHSNIYREDLKIIIGNLRIWLEEFHPQLLPYLDEKNKQLMQN